MAQDDLPPPDLFVVDGTPLTSGPDRARPRSIGTRIGMLLAAVALFAFGVVAGRSSVTVESGAATAAQTRSAPPTTTTVERLSPTTMSSWEPAAGETPSGSVADDAPPESSDFNQLRWPATPGSCAQPVPHPFVDSLGPPPSAPTMSVVAGNSAAAVDLSDGSMQVGLEDVTTLLDDPSALHFIVQSATDNRGTVLNVMHCNGQGASHIVRVTGPGKAAVLPIPGVDGRSSLLRGGDRIWVSVPSDGPYGSSPITVIAADTTGDSVTLPAGLVPLGAIGDIFIGQVQQDGNPVDSYALVDAATGEVLSTFGDQTDTGQDGMMAVADHGFVLAHPWSCAQGCAVHRYTVRSGETYRVDLGPDITGSLPGSPIAISSDGASAAYILYRQRPSPAPLTLNYVAPDDSATRLGLLDLATGELRTLPGVTLGAFQPLAATYSPDGAWLVVAVSEGSATRLLLYTAGGEGPYDPGVIIPGVTLWPLLEPAR